MVKGDRLQEGLGAQARPAREQALQVRGAEPRLIRQGIERGLVAPIFRNESQRVASDTVRGHVLLFQDVNLGRSGWDHPFFLKIRFMRPPSTLAKARRSWAQETGISVVLRRQ